MKKQATQLEKDYMEFVATNIPCLVCGQPACLHHPRFGAGWSQRSPHGLVIPLCREHHQGEYSVHGSPELFEKIEGTETELLNRTILTVFDLLRQGR